MGIDTARGIVDFRSFCQVEFGFRRGSDVAILFADFRFSLSESAFLYSRRAYCLYFSSSVFRGHARRAGLWFRKLVFRFAYLL